MSHARLRQLAASIDGRFGTENVGPLLAALIGFTRPTTLLEVGAGQTTLHILDALNRAVANDLDERAVGPPTHGVPAYYDRPYRPHLIVLDDFSNEHNTAHAVANVVTELRLDDLVTFRSSDFRGFSQTVDPTALPFDFVWFDCGGLEEYIGFVEEYWSLIDPDGGLLVLHSTQTNLGLRLFSQRLEQHLRDSCDPGFELINLLEPHKTSQNSVTIVRMTSQLSRPIYTLFP